MNGIDSTKVLQSCLNSKELKFLYVSYADTTLSVLGNGYVKPNDSLTWNGKKVVYMPPQKLHDCLTDKFIIQFTKFEIMNKDSVEVSLWLQRQGSGANFFLHKKNNEWVLLKTETYLY